MSCPLPLEQGAPGVESTTSIPEEVRRLLDAAPGPGVDQAWGAFVAVYSALLLRAAALHGADYDAVLDRYTYMLDELRRDDCRRLRRFVADGRAGFSSWLSVVARRLCFDHHRSRYGRSHRPGTPGGRHSAALASRRQLADLRSAVEDLETVEDSGYKPLDDALDEQKREELLARAVSLLPSADRALLRLRFEQELSAREIALRVGYPTPFHVYRRLQSICACLRAGITASGGRGPA
ncbi:MAG TPA: sigma-70 family RNA polymerase sigma factor [Gemmatimonadales bacterium]|nr:sigma-70 family RNA polymerase sigma factor [Gemmatimonadales bacterium]